MPGFGDDIIHYSISFILNLSFGIPNVVRDAARDTLVNKLSIASSALNFLSPTMQVTVYMLLRGIV